MRVIAGSARRLLLNTLPGEDTRPTTDRIKETLFNMIQFDIPGSTFLDLYAGSGGIAIEALSRGAVSATLVDLNPKAVQVIRANLEHTHLSEQAEVITGDAVSALKRMGASERKPFDLVFLDPPYDKGLEDQALLCLSEGKLIDEKSVIIVEMHLDADTAHFTEMPYQITRIKEYKTNKHVFLRKAVG